MIGAELLNFRILEQLGEGGMGVVYKGVDTTLDRFVAIKVLSSDLSRNPELVERFRAEARAQANLNHTNIATLYAFIAQAGQAWMIMEYIEGETITSMLERRGLLPPDVAVPLFKQALLGIGWAHRMGIVHRDIKPSNLMVNKQGIVKVMDFGIAKVMGSGRGLTRTGTALGTAYYMSPEQVMNQAIDIRSDIYSLGVTLYEMLTANLPFQGESDFQIMTSHVHAPPPPPTRHYPYIPRGVENAVLKAMMKEPAARFQTVEEFGAALEHPDDFGVTYGVAAPPMPPPGTQPPFAPPPPPPSSPPSVPGFAPPTMPPPPPGGMAGRPATTPPGGQQQLSGTAPTASITSPGAGFVPPPPSTPPGGTRLATPPPMGPPPSQPPVPPRSGGPGMKIAGCVAALALIGGGFGYFQHWKKVEEEKQRQQQQQQNQNGNGGGIQNDGKKDGGEVSVWPPPPSGDTTTAEMKIVDFDSDTRRVQPGQTAHLHWSVQGASHVTITPDIGDVDATGTKEIVVRRTTQFDLKATKLSGEALHRTVVVEVGTNQQPPPPPSKIEISFEAQPETITQGQGARLTWNAHGADQVIIAPEIGNVRPSGSIEVRPAATTTYRLQARAGIAMGTREVTVQVQPKSAPPPPPPPPQPTKPEITFQATPTVINAGGSATLVWALQNAVAANIMPQPGVLRQVAGRVQVNPTVTTTYTLTARSKDGLTDSAQVTVQVNSPGPPPGPYGNQSGNQGGRNTSIIAVVHDHGGAMNASSWPSCYGALQVSNGVLSFTVAGTVDGRRDDFQIPVNQVQDVQMNRLRIKNQPAFHIVVRGQHLNFVTTGMAASQAVAELQSALPHK